MELIILITILITASILTESIGVWGRVIGTINKKPTVGYSTHVRIATLGRFFTFLSAPLLGYLVDQSSNLHENAISSSEIALIGSLTFFLTATASFLFLLKGTNGFKYIYKTLNKKETIQNINYSAKVGKIKKRYFIIVGLSFFFTATGLITVNLLASLFPDYRAMTVQMSATITAFGTLLHVFFVDPQLSQAADQDNSNELKELATQFLQSRIIIGYILSILFITIYIYLLI